MKEQILEALQQLDPANPDHWTGTGLPKVEAVAALAVLPDLKRKDITEAAPDFLRDRAGVPLASPLEDFPDEADGGTGGGGDIAEKAALIMELQQRRVDLQSRVSNLRAERDAIARKEAEVIAEIDAITIEIDQLAGPATNTEAIQAYVKSQADIRAARVARHNRLVESGLVEPGELRRTIAPIDASMAANRARGRARPLHPPR